MIKLRQILESISSDKKFYHGTAKESAGLSILKDGIKPGNINIKRGNKLTPVMGKTYVTDNLKTAIIYTIGADMLGDDLSILLNSEGRYGYLFVIKGSQLNNPQPDEDSIGEILNILTDPNRTSGSTKYKIRSVELQWLVDLAKSKLTPKQFWNVKFYNDYADFAVAGKKLVKYMSTWQKEQLIDAGANVANEGNLYPEEAWKYDKLKNTKLKEDGSNFFQLAQKIK